MTAKKTTTPRRRKAAPAAEPQMQDATTQHPAQPVLDVLDNLRRDVEEGVVKGFAYVQFGTEGGVVFGHAGLSPLERAASPTYMMQHHLVQETRAAHAQQLQAEQEAQQGQDAFDAAMAEHIGRQH